MSPQPRAVRLAEQRLPDGVPASPARAQRREGSRTRWRHRAPALSQPNAAVRGQNITLPPGAILAH
eukprot:5648801-Pleurochrysis_carterae.AAC.2